MLRRLSRAAYAAWLGLLALAIQVAVPALVAVELSIADAEEVRSLCIFGAAQDRPRDTPAPPSDKHGIGACPICVALNGAQAFAAPDIASLPLPRSGEIDAIKPGPPGAPHLLTIGAYHSRAPPIG